MLFLSVLCHILGDPKYRQWGYEIFSSIRRVCRTEFAYAAVNDVRQPDGGGHRDSMESFFLAETLKYLYLLFSPRDKLDLEEFVLNTEAHPFRKFKTNSDRADTAIII
jgi:hypothetical protein